MSSLIRSPAAAKTVSSLACSIRRLRWFSIYSSSSNRRGDWDYMVEDEDECEDSFILNRRGDLLIMEDKDECDKFEAEVNCSNRPLGHQRFEDIIAENHDLIATIRKKLKRFTRHTLQSLLCEPDINDCRRLEEEYRRYREEVERVLKKVSDNYDDALQHPNLLGVNSHLKPTAEKEQLKLDPRFQASPSRILLERQHMYHLETSVRFSVWLMSTRFTIPPSPSVGFSRGGGHKKPGN